MRARDYARLLNFRLRVRTTQATTVASSGSAPMNSAPGKIKEALTVGPLECVYDRTELLRVLSGLELGGNFQSDDDVYVPLELHPIPSDTRYRLSQQDRWQRFAGHSVPGGYQLQTPESRPQETPGLPYLVCLRSRRTGVTSPWFRPSILSIGSCNTHHGFGLARCKTSAASHSGRSNRLRSHVMS